MSQLLLNDQWKLLEAPLNWQADKSGYVLTQTEGWMKDISLPCDVHMPLIDQGKIKDPVVADYSYDAQWIEQRSWWFKREIYISAEQMSRQTAELTLESLDVNADIFINGVWIGHHASAHYPFQKEIKPWIKRGSNVLLIRLTSGLETVTDQDLSEIDYAVSTEANNNCPDRGDKRRAFVRKPTYVYGWDWCPRIATCGITKQAWLSFEDKIAIRDLYAFTKSIETNQQGKHQAVVEIQACVELLDIISSAEGNLKLTITKDGEPAASQIKEACYLRSGLNYFTFETTLDNVNLWWPNGMGQQPLYELTAKMDCATRQVTYGPVKFGVRTIRLCTHRIDEQFRDFMIEVNGHNVFCKGGNWIPADSIYARVSDDKYKKLISEAKEANFNMLRIWGGGLYERDVFYEACDEAGILIWHDFMFGCSTYPDHLESFYDQVRKEIDYQTKRLRHHACLALFCGNNENHWIYNSVSQTGAIDIRQSKQYGLKISNILCPEIIKNNCPKIPYWNSSPYGGKEPNSPYEGDVHHWQACMMNPDMAKRIEPKEYDLVKARFVSEYGYPGPCALETIQDYFADQPVDRDSSIWQLHNNTFEKYTVNAGIAKHYTSRPLDLDQYLLYAGLTQALMLGYSLEALRFKTFCNGALFWMYNDCWGEVGWTIIDYSLRRKIAYDAVRRAFAPRRLILRETAPGQIAVTGCNESLQDISLDVAFGFASLDGSSAHEQRTKLIMKAGSRQKVLHFEAPVSRKDIICYVKPLSSDTIDPGILHAHDFKQLAKFQQKAALVETRPDGQDLIVKIEAKTYCHGVFLKTDEDFLLSDNYFDLLPGETKSIRVTEGKDATVELNMLDDCQI